MNGDKEHLNYLDDYLVESPKQKSEGSVSPTSQSVQKNSVVLFSQFALQIKKLPKITLKDLEANNESDSNNPGKELYFQEDSDTNNNQVYPFENSNTSFEPTFSQPQIYNNEGSIGGSPNTQSPNFAAINGLTLAQRPMTSIMVRATMTEDLSIIDSEAKSKTNKSVSITSE